MIGGKTRLVVILLFLLSLCALSAQPMRAQKSLVDVVADLLTMPAPPPPPGLPTSGISANKPVKTSSRFEQPPEDAPLEVLARYWAGIHRRAAGNLSDRLRDRLLDAAEAFPALLPNLMDKLSDDPVSHGRTKAVFDREHSAQRLGSDWFKKVRRHLMFHSRYFRNILVQEARAAHDNPKGGYVKKSDELKALARLDWSAAEPILREFAAGPEPRTSALALSLMYGHHVGAGNMDEAAEYRQRLKAIVGDADAVGRARETAADVLLGSQWDGRDEWYLSLFKDSTLRELHDGIYLLTPLTFPASTEPDKWIPILTNLVGSSNRVVHDAAVSLLVRFHLERARKDALLPLLPWLEDPDWSSARDRLRLIQSMDRLKMPESVPGLIAVLDQDDQYQRSYAAESLARYAPAEAVPALRRALEREKQWSHRSRIIKALIACKGVTTAEAVTAIEAFARLIQTEDGRKEVQEAVNSYGKTLSAQASLGLYLGNSPQPLSEQVVQDLLERIRGLEEGEPGVAKALHGILDKWPSKSADWDLLHRIESGKADAAAIRAGLRRRELVRETIFAELERLATAEGVAAGVASVILGEPKFHHVILEGADTEAQSALLASARLVREPLPVNDVGLLLRSEDELVSRAAEAYLRAEDGPQARKLVLARHADEALILGARQEGDPGHNTYSAFDSLEENLRQMVLNDGGPDEVFALLSAGYWGDNGQIVLRVQRDSGTLSFHQDSARYYSRAVSEGELQQLRGFLSTNMVEDHGPLSTRSYDGMQYEFVHLKPAGGRRVFMNNPGVSGTGGTVYDRLTSYFLKLLKVGNMELAYSPASAIPGFEVLFARVDLPVLNVWKVRDDFRLLVLDERPAAATAVTTVDDGEARVSISSPEEPERKWVAVTNGKVSAEVNPPHEFMNPGEILVIPPEFDWEEGYHPFPWALSVPGGIYRVGTWKKQRGIWKFVEGRDPELIADCTCIYPVLTPDGRWAVLAVTDRSWAEPNTLFRVNLVTKERFPVDIPAADTLNPITYVAAHGSVLVLRARDDDGTAGPATPEFFLLDAETGKSTGANGEFGPLMDSGGRPLQPAGEPNQVWASLYDESADMTQVGWYDTRNFTFRPVLPLPSLQLDSRHVWIDEPDGWVYLAYRGHLLRVPLPSD